MKAQSTPGAVKASDGSLALVTGATSGIGLAVARDLGARGHRVFICARTETDVKQTVEDLRADGMEVEGAAADVRNRAEVKGLVAAAVATFDRPVRILVNNAGRSGGGATADLTDELWEEVIDTNLNSVFLVTREALTNGGLAAAGRGRIVNIASTAGKQGVLLGAPYSASKHAVVGLTKALGKELAPLGITVNAVCPGYVETPMAARVRAGYARVWDTTEQYVQQQFEAQIPLGRFSTPEEVAGLVSYLTTDLAASITAQALNVCGGLGRF
ncbi:MULTISPECIES: SDR family NAD(P)-dependent oxidoreductase [unclassified Streptomyces]|uniref:SDR family NAD(P)-dependent oxidoreductase n=1 Tax=unclassified Streptomyces TaxID=2593676 RepID=UPI002E321111|nr:MULTISPECIES: SDR family NAD(P)-dependent oxidoreductase [unclassified Streptomyces]WUC67862.1 SDR family NAD(P)-dependent oxidoreductase [Streptomyces sp. NBC_00539]